MKKVMAEMYQTLDGELKVETPMQCGLMRIWPSAYETASALIG